MLRIKNITASVISLERIVTPDMELPVGVWIEISLWNDELDIPFDSEYIYLVASSSIEVEIDGEVLTQQEAIDTSTPPIVTQIDHNNLSNITATDHHNNSNDPTTDQKDALNNAGILSGANPLVSQGTLTNHVSDTNNPHSVTSALIGAATTTDLTNHINDSNNPHIVTTTQIGAIPTSEKAAASGVCDLDAGGKVPASRIPAVALPEVSVVVDATTRLALTVQEGDEAIQTDDGSHWIYDGSAWYQRTGGTGNVLGPGSSTDEAVARYDGATGAILQNSNVLIDDSGNISTSGTVDGRNVSADGTTLDNHVPDTNNPHSVTKTQVGLGEVQNIKNNFAAVVAPTTSEDSTQGYSVGSHWIDIINDLVYVCVDPSISSAKWKVADTGQVAVDNLDTHPNYLFEKLCEGTGISLEKTSCVGGINPIISYLLDEAATGQTPTQVIDSQTNPYNLNISYDVSQPAYFSGVTGKGLEWYIHGDGGGPVSPTPLVAGNKLYDALQGSTKMSLCCVVDISNVTSSYSRIMHLGVGTSTGDLTLQAPNSTTVYVGFNNTRYPGYDVHFNTFGRMILHIVIDTTQANSSDRIKLFKNGIQLGSSTGSFPSQNSTLSISSGALFYLGNRANAERSFDGTMQYAAIYDVALNEDQIAEEATNLATDDDISPVPLGCESPKICISATGSLAEQGYNEDEPCSTTSSQSWEQVFRYTQVVDGGTYRVDWYSEIRAFEAPDGAIDARLQRDDTDTYGDVRVFTGSSTYNRIDDFVVFAGFKIVTLTAGSHNFDLDIRSHVCGSTGSVEIRRKRIAVQKWG